MTPQVTHDGLPNGMTRWQFFGLIDSARQQLGLSKGCVAYLKVAISCTIDEILRLAGFAAFGPR